MFKKFIAFFHRHPGVKRTVVGALGAAANAAAMGAFGPKAAAVAALIGALTANTALEVKRPKDATPEDKGEVPAPKTDGEAVQQ